MENIELENKYNELLKGCKTVDEVHALRREFENSCAFPEIRTKKGDFVVNNFFGTINPKKIEYICDSDVYVRCCKIENLWKSVRFCVR